MRKSAFWLAVAVGAVPGVPVQAEVATYDCTVNSLEGRGFIPDRIIFSVDTAQKVAGVVDGIIMGRYETPIPADFAQLRNGNYRLKWKVENLKSGAQSFYLDYTLTYFVARNSLNIRTRVKGYDNRPFGTGTCQLTQGQSVLP